MGVTVMPQRLDRFGKLTSNPTHEWSIEKLEGFYTRETGGEWGVFDGWANLLYKTHESAAVEIRDELNLCFRAYARVVTDRWQNAPRGMVCEIVHKQQCWLIHPDYYADSRLLLTTPSGFSIVARRDEVELVMVDEGRREVVWVYGQH